MENQITFTQTTDINLAVKESFFLIFKKRFLIVAGFFYILVLLINLDILILGNQEDEINTQIQLTLKPVYIILTVIPFVALFFWFRLKSHFSKPAFSRFITDIDYRFSNEAFSREGSDFFIRNKWEEIFMIKEKGRSFNIYHNKQQFSIIDKSKLTTAQILELKTLFYSLKPKVKVSLK